MKTEYPCDTNRLAQFLEADDYQIEDSDLVAHLDSCKSCQQLLEEKAADKQTWEHLIATIKPKEFDEASTSEFSAATLFGEPSSQPVVIQDVLDSLTPSEHPDRLGRLGNYEITGIVGVGGMGVVLKGVDSSLDRVVAIKVMAPRLANNEIARQRFAREAKAAAAVHHPNVIPIHSVDSTGPLPFFVMTYVRGESLQKRLDREGSLSLVEVLRIGSQIAAGLSAAHGQGLVHRDIKPENILMEEGVERVTVTDFGLARAVDDNTVTQQGTIAGTPRYMSPEQARGERLDQQTDLFSLGSVLYAMRAGRPPYEADSSYGVMRKIIEDDPTQLRKLSSDTPEWLAQIISKLMERKKSKRIQFASEVQVMLEGCLSYVQQPDMTDLPTAVQDLANQASLVNAQPSLDSNKRGRLSGIHSRIRSIILVILIVACGSLAFPAARNLLAKIVLGGEKPAFKSVGGGVAGNGEGWSILTGSSYFATNQPGVIFGVHERPDSNRELSYVLLIRHNARNETNFRREKSASLDFDGARAHYEDGLRILGKNVELALDMQVSNQIDAFEFEMNGQTYDLKKGHVFVIDMTQDSLAVAQIDTAYSKKIPDPTDLSGDVEMVEEFVGQLFEEFAKSDARLANFLQACKDPAIATPGELFALEPEQMLRPRELEMATSKSFSGEFVEEALYKMQLRESELRHTMGADHPSVVQLRERMRLAKGLLPELQKLESKVPNNASLLKDLFELRLREQTLRETVGPDHPAVAALQERLRLLTEKMDEIGVATQRRQP